jgi:hypothetical protein
LLGGEQYTLVQVGKASHLRARMEDRVTVGAEREEVSSVMLPAGTTDKMVDFHSSSSIAFWPPADGAGAEEGGEVSQHLLALRGHY